MQTSALMTLGVTLGDGYAAFAGLVGFLGDALRSAPGYQKSHLRCWLDDLMWCAGFFGGFVGLVPGGCVGHSALDCYVTGHRALPKLICSRGCCYTFNRAVAKSRAHWSASQISARVDALPGVCAAIVSSMALGRSPKDISPARNRATATSLAAFSTAG